MLAFLVRFDSEDFEGWKKYMIDGGYIGEGTSHSALITKVFEVEEITPVSVEEVDA